MAKRYSVLGSGVLALVFIAWMFVVSVLAGVVAFIMALNNVKPDAYTNYLILGAPELLLILPLIVYMALTKTGAAALMGNRTSLRQNLLAALVGILAAPAFTGLGELIAWLFSILGARELFPSIAAPATAGELLVSILVVGALAGAVEEPVFRGVVLRGMGSAAGKRAAVVLTALTFALVHFEVVGLLPRFLIGLALGYMAWRAGAVLPGVFMHAAYNSTLMAMAFALPDWRGFTLLPGAPVDVNGMLTWVLIAVPTAAAAFGAYRLFARATPESSAWSAGPYAPVTKASHLIPWIAAGAVLVSLTVLVAAVMFLPAGASPLAPYFR